MRFIERLAEAEGKRGGNRRAVWVSAAVIVVLAAFPVFGLLTDRPLHVWDEARNAVNALEMYTSGNWLVVTYRYEPDLWNTKPPLLAWFQATAFHVLGPGELAVRLPSALACIGIFLAMWRFSVERLQSPITGLLAPLILITMPCFLGHHAGRTGDYDPLLTLCVFLSALSYFAWTEDGRPSRILVFWLLLALGCLTKSVAGLLATPVYLLYLLWTGKLPWTLRQWGLWAGAGLFLLLVAGFYLGREAAAPGFLKAVLSNEIFSRYLAAAETNNDAWYYYFLLFLTRMSSVWGPLAFLGLVLIVYRAIRRSRNRPMPAWLESLPHAAVADRFMVFCALFVVVQLGVLSISKTKLPWYSLPAMPFLALLAAEVVRLLYVAARRRLGATVASACLVLLFAWPFVEACQHPFKLRQRKESDQYQLAALLQKGFHDQIEFPHLHDYKGFTVVMHDLFSPYEIYAEFFRMKGRPVFVKEYDALQVGEVILSTKESALQECLAGRYELKRLWRQDAIYMDSVVAVR